MNYIYFHDKRDIKGALNKGQAYYKTFVFEKYCQISSDELVTKDIQLEIQKIKAGID